MTNDCSCIKNNYNLWAIASDRKTILYRDLSDWMEGPNFDQPVQYIVNITVPGSFKEVPVVLDVFDVNPLTKEELGSIKDGIYCFKVLSCGIKYIRSKAIFPFLECCVKQAWATLEDIFEDKIREVEKHMELANINAELNNVRLASDNLSIAKKLLDNLKCHCDC